MSKYGVSLYGPPTVYGPDISATYSGSVTSQPIGYGSIRLSWSTPTGTWGSFRIVRNPYGIPTDSDDGVSIFESPNGTPQYFVDQNLLEGSEYYYAVFVLDLTNNVWHRVTYVSGISVKDFGTYALMWSYLPLAARSASRNVADTSSENQDLSDFIRLLAFEYDYEKTQAYLIRQVYSPQNSPSALLQLLLSELGITNEPNISGTRMRVLAKNAISIYQKKGSVAGLRDFVKAFSGYDTVIASGKNLCLTYNDSSFEDSIGSWSSTTATLSLESSAIVVPYIETLSPIGFPNRQAGSLKVTSIAGGTVTLSTGGTTPILLGIPVTAGTSYTYSAYTQAATTAQLVTLSISWYSISGTLISTTSGTSVTNALGSWTRAAYTYAAPTGSAYATLSISIAGTSTGEVHYVDAVQLEVGTAATTFQDARMVEVNVSPNRINELLNPNFTTSTLYWSETNASSAVLTSASGTNPHVALSGSALEVYPTAASEVTIYSDNITTIVPSEYYTFSMYGSVGSYGTAMTTTELLYTSVKWYDAASTLLSESVGGTVQIMRDYLGNWETNSAPISEGTLAIASDTMTFKVGNGVASWNALPYASAGITYVYNTSTGFTSTYVLERGAIGVETDTYKFKIGDGVTQWSLLPYFNSLPAWVRPSVTGVAPVTAAYAVPTMHWIPSSTSMSIIVDEGLFEKAPSVGAFFDGSTGYEDTGGLRWEATPNASRSALYRNWTAVFSRLMVHIPEQLYKDNSFIIQTWPTV